MVGKTISHYEILERLGGGGMGVVYKARDLKLDRIVALKFLAKDSEASEKEKERFLHEARAASALNHQNVCMIHEIDETPDGQLFIAMEYCAGETLRQRIAGGPLSLHDALQIAGEIASGLRKAHQAHIVHRDIKPANIIITTDGIVKIVDFGLAKIANLALTKTGAIIGTVSYMSPEQAQGDPLDHRTDIWSLGVILYEMLTGTNPFKGENHIAMIHAVTHKTPPSIRELRPDVPPRLVEIVDKALAKNPDQRYQDAAALQRDLLAVRRDLEMRETQTVALRGETQTLSPARSDATATVAAAPENRGKPKHLLGRIAAAGLLLGLVGFAWFYWQQQQTAAPATVDLSIASQPAGATVLINGEEAGMTPITERAQTTGSITLRLQKAGYLPFDTSFALQQATGLQVPLIPVKMTAGETTLPIPASEVEAESEAAPARSTNEPAAVTDRSARDEAAAPAQISLRAIPDGRARIEPGGETIEVQQSKTLSVAPGEHTVVFTQGANQSPPVPLQLRPGQQTSLSCFFEHYVSVQVLDGNGEPIWAVLAIDGTSTGLRTPLDRHPLPPGTHSISVMRYGYETVEAPVSLTVEPVFEEKVHRLVFHLRKK